MKRCFGLTNGFPAIFFFGFFSILQKQKTQFSNQGFLFSTESVLLSKTCFDFLRKQGGGCYSQNKKNNLRNEGYFGKNKVIGLSIKDKVAFFHN